MLNTICVGRFGITLNVETLVHLLLMTSAVDNANQVVPLVLISQCSASDLRE